jgi:hypothetical protein
MDTLTPAAVVGQHERSSRMRAAAVAAAAAPRWPLNLWLESGLWVCLALSLGVSYTVSYSCGVQKLRSAADLGEQPSLG